MAHDATNEIVATLSASLQYFFQHNSRLSKNAGDIRAFIEELKPDIELLFTAAMQGRAPAADSLDLLADAAVARATRLALVAAAEERAAVGAIVLATLRMAAKLAIGI